MGGTGGRRSGPTCCLATAIEYAGHRDEVGACLWDLAPGSIRPQGPGIAAWQHWRPWERGEIDLVGVAATNPLVGSYVRASLERGHRPHALCP